MISATGPKVPTFDELMWPTLKALKAMGGSASNEELLGKIIEIEKLPDAVQTFIHTDNRQTKLNCNLAWAKTYLKRVSAIENSARGVWSVTDHGEKLTEADCEQIPAIVRRQDYERKKSRGDQGAEEHPLSVGPTPEESWKDTLLAVLRKMPQTHSRDWRSGSCERQASSKLKSPDGRETAESTGLVCSE